MNQLQPNNPAAVQLATGGNVEVLVFKTNLSDEKRIADVESALDIHPGIYKWNIDLNDCDYVLRIVSRNIAVAEVEQMILSNGYYCEELQ